MFFDKKKDDIIDFQQLALSKLDLRKIIDLLIVTEFKNGKVKMMNRGIKLLMWFKYKQRFFPLMFSRKKQALDRAKRRDEINKQNIVQLEQHVRVYTQKH